MVGGQLHYEEIRKQRLEENKKKLDDLKLTHHLQNLRNAAPAKQKKPRKNPVNEANLEVRRSSRVADLPAPDYKGTTVQYSGEIDWRPRTRSQKKPRLPQRVYASDEARYAVKRANEVQSNLDPDFPSFVKPILHSHVSAGFKLGLPRQFCELYLPKDDTTMTLIDDESEEEHKMRYVTHRTGILAGWKDFSVDHELVEGDAVVFQLISAKKFKVYIIRASESSE